MTLAAGDPITAEDWTDRLDAVEDQADDNTDAIAGQADSR